MNKTATLFATLRARYGQIEMKDGQNVQAVMPSYQTALGTYHEQDLNSACTDWINTRKYPRSSEPVEALER